MSPTLVTIYKGNLEVLVSRRTQLIAEIESINKQIADLKGEAKKYNIKV